MPYDALHYNLKYTSAYIIHNLLLMIQRLFLFYQTPAESFDLISVGTMFSLILQREKRT